jgi:hypothetical protein
MPIIMEGASTRTRRNAEDVTVLDTILLGIVRNGLLVLGMSALVVLDTVIWGG